VTPARRARLLSWLPWLFVAALAEIGLPLPAWASALGITVAVGTGLGAAAAGWQPRAERLAASRERHPSVRSRSRMDASGTELYVPVEWLKERER
jgi:hypothetical protein